MKTTTLTYKVKPIAIICSFLLFIAVLNLPIQYYTFLRIIIFIGAILVIPAFIKKHLILVVTFGIIAVLFNPIIPIYLYVKDYWIPIDIISALLFLLVLFFDKTQEKPRKTEPLKTREFKRDKIY